MGLLKLILNLVSYYFFFKTGAQIGETGVISFTTVNYILIALLFLVSFISNIFEKEFKVMFTLSKELKQYTNIPNVKSTKSNLFITALFTLLFSGIVAPFSSFFVCFIWGFIKSGFSNFTLLSFIFLMLGIYIIYYSIAVGSLIGFSKLDKIFENNKDFCVHCYNQRGTALNAFATTFVKNHREEFDGLVDLPEEKPKMSMEELMRNAQQALDDRNKKINSIGENNINEVNMSNDIPDFDEDIEDIFSNSSNKTQKPSTEENVVKNSPIQSDNRVISQQNQNRPTRPTRPTRPSRANNQNVVKNEDEIDDLFK